MIDIATAHSSVNIADDLDSDVLDSIGRDLCLAIEEDDRTRAGWIDSQGE